LRSSKKAKNIDEFDSEREFGTARRVWAQKGHHRNPQLSRNSGQALAGKNSTTCGLRYRQRKKWVELQGIKAEQRLVENPPPLATGKSITQNLHGYDAPIVMNSMQLKVCKNVVCV